MSVDPLLTPLLGTWRGTGTGTMPGMNPFEYEEEVRFLDIGSADLAYFQRAWGPATEEVLHAEAGMWRATGAGRVVATIAQARRTEISEGSAEGGRIELASTSTSAAGGVMPVTSSRRSYRLNGDQLTYEYAMATRDTAEVERHLSGTARRQPET